MTRVFPAVRMTLFTLGADESSLPGLVYVRNRRLVTCLLAACLVKADSYFLTGSFQKRLQDKILPWRRVISTYGFNLRYDSLGKLMLIYLYEFNAKTLGCILS